MYKYLAHHGILGQKWGVRRYRNYDGSYTRAGLKRYDASKANYDSKKAHYKKLKSSGADKQSVKLAKGEMKVAERKMNKDYKHLKIDKMADKGKERYQLGQTITGRNTTLSEIGTAAGFVSAGAQFLKRANYLDSKTANMITASSACVSGGIWVAGKIREKGNRELRAYYSHSSKY